MYQNLNLHIRKTAGKDTFEASIVGDGGNIVARHGFSYSLDHYILSRLEDRMARNVAETSKLIRDFGSALFNAVFGGEVLVYYKSLTNGKKDTRLRLVFTPDDGDLLRLPWEFLFDGTNFLSACQPISLSRTLVGAPAEKKDPIAGKIRVLVVVSSPLNLKDHERLNFEQEQILIMEAVDRAHAANQIEVDFLDEASLKNIQDRLDEEEFHILHYTGHGAFSEKEDRGYLVLEDGHGDTRPVDNNTFADLLAGYKSLRLVVLSGCQTAKTSGRRAFADLATPLLMRNIPAVVAMQYSVSDRSAIELAQKLYIEIGRGSPVDLALTRARRALYLAGDLGSVEFATPVLYTGDADCLTVAKTETKPRGIGFDKKISIEPNVVLGIEQLGRQFIGRRRELRRIKEGYLQRGIRVVVLHGIGGIGKTVTAAKAAETLKEHVHGVYAFDCREDLTPEKILLQLNDFLLRNGIKELDQAAKSDVPIEAKVGFLAQVLSQIRLLIIFDNFETQLSEAKGKREIANPDLKKALKTLVTQTKDGARFLFTSRYTFDLTDGRMTNLIDEINLAEMSRPEAIMIMNRFAVLADEDFATKLEIFGKIGGHPYTINIFGRHANISSARAVLDDLAGVQREMIDFTLINKSYAQLGDRAKKLMDSVAVFRKAIPQSGIQWLMKEGKNTPDVTKELEELVHWGLIVKIDEEDDPAYQVHTLVKDFVKSVTDGDEWKRRLLRAALYYEELTATSRDVWDRLESRDLYFDAGEYEKAGDMVATMMQVLYTGGLIELVRRLNEQTIETASSRVKAAAWHHLGMIHQAQGDYAGALAKYTESLLIFEELGDKSGKARTRFNLAAIHQAQGDYAGALAKYTESLLIFEELGDKSGKAFTLHHVGAIHQNQGDYAGAMAKYTESLLIFEELGDKSGKAYTLHQVGMIHEAQGDYAEALAKYTESLLIFEELGDKSGKAKTLHQVGMIHQDQGDYAGALAKYTESLKIEEELGARLGIAQSLHQVGMICQKQGDYAGAMAKYTESLLIFEELGDKSGIAITIGQMGRVYEAQKKYKQALRNYLTAVAIFEELKSPDLRIAVAAIKRTEKKVGKKGFEKLMRELEAESEGKTQG